MSFIFFRRRNLFFLAQTEGRNVWFGFPLPPDDLCSRASYEAPHSLFPVAAGTRGFVELETVLYRSHASAAKYVVR